MFLISQLSRNGASWSQINVCDGKNGLKSKSYSYLVLSLILQAVVFSFPFAPWDLFPMSSHTMQWLKNWHSSGYLPGAWRCRVSAGTFWPCVGILWLGEVESLICNFCICVAARKLVLTVRPWNTLACCCEVKQPTYKQTNKLVLLKTLLHSRLYTVWLCCFHRPTTVSRTALMPPVVPTTPTTCLERKEQISWLAHKM